MPQISRGCTVINVKGWQILQKKQLGTGEEGGVYMGRVDPAAG
jgi:hypothetical protein